MTKIESLIIKQYNSTIKIHFKYGFNFYWRLFLFLQRIKSVYNVFTLYKLNAALKILDYLAF